MRSAELPEVLFNKRDQIFILFFSLYAYFPAVQPDGSYTTSQQAVSQLYALGITMALSIVGGIVTGNHTSSMILIR